MQTVPWTGGCPLDGSEEKTELAGRNGSWLPDPNPFFGALATHVPGFLAFLVVVGLLVGALFYCSGTGARRRLRALKLSDVDTMRCSPVSRQNFGWYKL
jgi:hypothetical protein